MARKASAKSSPTTTPTTTIASSTPVRNSPVPRARKQATTAPAMRQITHEMIAQRAYEIHLSGQGGSDVENWLRAERELRGA